MFQLVYVYVYSVLNVLSCTLSFSVVYITL